MVAVHERQKPASLFANRYQLFGLIGRGGMGTVYRAVDRLRGESVALKRVYWREGLYWPRRSSSYGTHDDLTLALAHEFRILASMRHPNIISVLDYGFDEERKPYFTMSILENTETIVDAGFNKPISTQIELLIQLLRALDYLHRRQIIHCDLKPSNVLVANGQVKVLDFGLSTQVGEIKDTSGSLLYMAPELFDDTPPSIASDLYAVGVIAYEMLTGAVPFTDEDVTELIVAIQGKTPDLSNVGVFTSVLSTLLAKQPGGRLGSARQTIAELGKLLPIAPPAETAEVRESLLQAAQFIGRENELALLRSALRRTQDGRGSAWLIAGESGAGKSRLLDELQVSALVDGTLVVRGQSISQGGSPYQMWRPVLRWLCLLTDLSVFEASVLKPLIVDIESLLQRSVPDAADADPLTVQSRLITVIESILRRQAHPIVILLEDVQWAGDESITILARLSNLIAKLPILILASFRDDDKPDLPTFLPKMEILSLKRLSEEATANLTSAILGTSDIQGTLPHLLYQETEGNIFFLIEIMRSLTEEAGQLDAIGAVDFPAHILTGGMRSFVQRRLNRVQPKYQMLLKLAAVGGRQLDLEILHQLDPMMDLTSWLDNCVNVAVLEIRDGLWQFAHDKLREELLQSIAPGDRRYMHRQVALSVETLYVDSPEYAAPLAYQWGEAGDTGRQFKYLVRAGEDAQQKGANRFAADFLDKAAHVAAQLQVSSSELSEVERLRGEAYLALGNLTKSVLHMKDALKLLGSKYPPERRLLLACLGAATVQAVHLLGFRAISSRKNASDHQLKLAQAYLRIGLYYYFTGQSLSALHGVLNCLNHAERVGTATPVLAEAYANAAFASGVLGFPKLARSYFRKSDVCAQKINQPRIHASLAQRKAVYELGQGHWGEVEQHLREGTMLAQGLGDERMLREMLLVSFFPCYFQGRFPQGMALIEQIQVSAKTDNDVQSLLYCAAYRSAMFIRAGKYDDAIASLSEFSDLSSPAIPASERGRILNVFGQLGLAYFYKNDFGTAHQALEFVASTLTASAIPEASFALVLGYTACLETCLGLRERSAGDDGVLRAITAVLMKGFRSLARSFELGLPGLLRMRGLAQWLDGRHTSAQRSWLKALDSAARLSMPLEEGLILGEIGRHSNHDAVKSSYLTRSAQLFDDLGLPFDVEWYAKEASMTTQTDSAAQAGARIYSDANLRFYDVLILGVSNRLVWRCPSFRILDFYNKNVSANHLDIGVGTGYFLDKCHFPSDQPQISLLDLNPASLKVTAKRLQRYHPATYVANILDPLRMTLPTFDSIGLSYLIHCLPGSMPEKLVIFRNLKSRLNPGGVIFGTTILGKGVPHNLAAKALIGLYNKTGIFGNANDTLADLEQALRENFQTFSLDVVGCVAFFAAKA